VSIKIIEALELVRYVHLALLERTNSILLAHQVRCKSLYWSNKLKPSSLLLLHKTNLSCASCGL